MAPRLNALLRPLLQSGSSRVATGRLAAFARPLAQRTYASDVSRDPFTGELTSLPDINPKALQYNQNHSPGTPPSSDKLTFGRVFTDHMLTIPWNSVKGWGKPVIGPYGPLALDPSSTVFHYAFTLFEGMKAYRCDDGTVRLFRPDKNMARMNTSAARIALPQFDGEALTQLIKRLVMIDSNWIPGEPGHSLYIRPTMIGTQAGLGVGPSSDALLFVICSPVGPYYPTGFKPVSLLATSHYTRAGPGGTGAYKLGANYAPGVVPQVEAAKSGYAQNLWLIGKEHYLTEVGTMNLFVVLDKPDGTWEIVTPPLEDIILPGVTRDSILSLLRDHAAGTITLPGLPSKIEVNERAISMGEIKQAKANDTLREIFGSGTAALVSPVDNIGYEGKDISVPTGPEGLGQVAKSVLNKIVAIQMGKEPHKDWSVIASEGI
ncbi:branched-chain-amino-acid aminotransferase [Phaffia rhodozyma]|uniref:Branched-chain-amino-acid aminotransferase n=1 Tax=Phaffia rhodozyma TaxID=264483 RepID=A0A0F7SL73_PHARH|nr:branched-chain-amino-acid aminotransferase [Phaffia rhodozyma]